MRHTIKRKLRWLIQKLILLLRERQCAICDQPIDAMQAIFISETASGILCGDCTVSAVRSLALVRVTKLSSAGGLHASSNF